MVWTRTASKRDIVEISELLALVWRHTYSEIYGAQRVEEMTRQFHSAEVLQKRLNIPESEFLVADNGEFIIAVAYAWRMDSGEVKLYQLYVLPDFQSRGIGKMLLDEIEESFFESKEYILEVERQNTRAIKFYENNGFRKTGESTINEFDLITYAKTFS